MDIAAHVREGHAPHVGFIKLDAPAFSLPAGPMFLFGPATRAALNDLFALTPTHDIGCYTLEDAVLAPTGIAIKSGIAFSSPAFIHPPYHVQTVAARLHAVQLPARHVRGPLAVLYGPGHQTYGHWLVDFLPRLFVLAQCGFDILATRFAVPPDITPVATQLLSCIGIRESQLVPYRYWREVIHTDLLVMPTILRAENRFSPHFAAATEFWTAPLMRAAGHNVPGPERIFLSRGQAPSGRHLTNRAQVETLAQERGYTVVHPEKLSVFQQVSHFTGARIIAGEYGSALHGSVYARPHTVIVALRGTARHPSFIQSGLAQSLQQQIGYVLGETTGEVEQRFTVQPEDLERAFDIAAFADQARGP
jgi:capsular polysaccharide biosynthesis protein